MCQFFCEQPYILLTELCHSRAFKTYRLFCREYVIMVCLFFGSSVLNNYALNFGIPMPLHMIFKSVSDIFTFSYVL